MAPALEFRRRDRLETDSIAGPDWEVAGFEIGDAKGSRPQQMPSPRRVDGIDGRLAADGQSEPVHEALMVVVAVRDPLARIAPAYWGAR